MLSDCKNNCYVLNQGVFKHYFVDCCVGSSMRSLRLAPKTKMNIMIIFISVFLYLLNRLILKDITEGLIHWFLVCYWNDITGAIAVSAYVDSIIFHYSKKEIHFWGLIGILLACGIFWEFITPLFRKNSVCDFWDIVAYMSGGVIYYLSIRLCEKYVPKTMAEDIP